MTSRLKLSRRALLHDSYNSRSLSAEHAIPSGDGGHLETLIFWVTMVTNY